jgi:PKD repeat protein
MSWSWNFGDPGSGINNVSNLQNPVHTFTIGSNVYNVTLAIQNFNGCRDTIVKPVYTLPKPPVDFIHDSACSGQIVTYLADTLITHIDSIVSWSWNFGDGSSPVNNPVTATHTYTAPGTYITTLTITDHHGCINSVSHGINVHPLPIAQFSWSSPICAGSPVHFNDNSSIPLGYTGYIAKWLWEFGDGTSQLISLPNSPNVIHIFVGTSMSHIVRLTVWTNDSCSQYIENTIISIPSPVANFDYSTVRCKDQPVQFTDLSQTNGGGSISQWSWNFDDPASGISNTSNLQNPLHSYINPGNYNVTLVVTNLTGCSDTLIKTIQIDVPPVADFHADTACLYNSTQFTDLSSPNATSIISYTWDFGDGSPLSHQQNPNHTYALSGTFNVKLTIVNSNGCSKDTTKAVLVNPLPIPAFSFSSPNCFGSPVQYTDFSTIPPGYLGSIVKWVWDFGDGTSVTINAPTNPNVSHTFIGNALSHNVRLTVTTSDGCSSFIEQKVSSIPSPSADFSFPATNCTTQFVQFTDHSQTNGGGAIGSWHWNFGDPVSGLNNISTIQNPLHLFTGPGNYNVTLIISNTSSCSDTVLKAITINSPPVANFTADTACLHQSTQFTDISIPNAPTIISYSWDFGDGSPLSNLQNPSHTYTSYGTMNVKLTITNSNGCTKDTIKQVMVRPLPQAEFTFSSNDCHGSAIQYTDHSSIVPGYNALITQWMWNFGDGTPPVTILYPGNPNITHIFAGTSNAYTVRLTVTTADGCSDFIEHIVSTIPSPVANFTYPTVNCVQQSVQFTDISQTNGGGNIIQWIWNFGDPISGLNNTSSLQNPVHLFSVTGTYTVTEIIFNSSNCSDSSFHTITITPAPVADFTADTTCLGSSSIFTNLSSSSGGSITQYLWNFGDGSTSTLKNPVHNYLTSGNFQVELSVTTQDGCSNSITKPVFVIPRPVVAFTTSGPACLGATVQFTDNSLPVFGSIHSWTWDFGDGTTTTIVEPASPNITHIYSSSGTFNVTLTVVTSSNCSSSITNHVIIQPNPTANFIYSSSRCEMSPMQFTNTSQTNGGSPITQWLWNFNDPGSGLNNTSTLQDPIHSFSANGSFNVRLIVTNENGCVDSITKPISINKKPVAQFSSEPACAHSATQFTDHSIPNGSGFVSWLWNFGDPSSGTNNTSSLQNPSHVYSNVGIYSVTLTVINANLCENDTLMQVSIPSSPTAMFTFTSSCVKSPTQFTDQSIAPNSQITSWFWDFGDGVGTSTIQNPVYTYTSSGTYNVKLRVTNLSNCVDSIIIPVASYPVPMAAFSYNSFFCPAGQVMFTDQSHGEGSVITERLWIFEPGSTSTQPDPTFVFPVTDTTYLVTLIVTDDKGCKDTTTQSVFVKPKFSFTFSHDTVCFGSPTHFHAHDNTQGDSLYSLHWNFGDPASGINNTSTLYNPTHVFSSSNSFVVSLKAWDSDNCADSVYQTTLVHASPKPGYSFVSQPCDSLISFIDQSSAGGGVISSWSWNFGDGTQVQTIVPPASGNTTHIFDVTGNYRVGLKVTNSFGCYDTISQMVGKLSCVSASFIQNVLGACTNASVIFTDSSQPINQVSSWHWNFGDGTDTTYTRYSHEIRHTYTNSGDYNVRLSVTAVVYGHSYTDTAKGMITINHAPEALFSVNPVCLNKATMFIDLTNTYETDISSRKWNFGDPSSGIDNISVSQNPSHKYHSPGNYDVNLVVINKSGCKDSLTVPTQVFALPSAKFDNNPACSHNPTQFFDRSIAIDTTIERWYWNFGVTSTKKDTSMRKNPSYVYKKEGNYDVKLTVQDYHGCYDTIDSIIKVNPSPLSAFLLLKTFQI